jgi:hypothetical protein
MSAMKDEAKGMIGLGLFGVALPAGIIYLIARTSGWNTLAERYPLRSPFPRPRTRFGFGVFHGWVGYNGALIVASDEAGLYLRATPVLLSWCHPPIFIPWSEIAKIEQISGWEKVYRLHTLQAPEVDFALLAGTFAVIREDARRAGVPGDY